MLPIPPALLNTTAATFNEHQRGERRQGVHPNKQNLAAIEAVGATPYIDMRETSPLKGGKAPEKMRGTSLASRSL